MNARRRAWEVLQSIDQGRRWARSPRGDRDDAFVQTLVSGVLRWRLTIDHIIRELSGRELRRIDPPALQLLRLGIYQIHWMRTADHAAVNESVELAKRVAPRASSFVNAILRRATREDLEALIPRGEDLDSASIQLSHPPWLLQRWQETFGAARARRIAAANQELSYPDILIDGSRISVGEVRARLDAAGVPSHPSSRVDGMVRVEGSTASLADLIASGAVWPMDEGSAIVALLVGRAGSVLDLAAAPGGKSIAMAQRNEHVVAHDVAIDRLAPLRGRPRVHVVAGDGRRPAFRTRFDAVLLDAPCSASGIVRKHPEIKWRLSEEIIARSAELQRSLIRSAAELTGERLVYATCSLERDENDAVVRSLIDSSDQWEIEDARESLPPGLHDNVSRGVLRLTSERGTDGFTAFVIRRRKS